MMCFDKQSDREFPEISDVRRRFVDEETPSQWCWLPTVESPSLPLWKSGL